MKSFYLNSDGDLELDTLNNIKMVEGSEEIKQRLRLSLSTNNGQWFLNLNFGIPWLELLPQKNAQSEIKYQIIKVLSQDPAVKKVNFVELNFEGAERKLLVEFELTLVDGQGLRETWEVM